MKTSISNGYVICNAREVVIKIDGENPITLNAQADELKILTLGDKTLIIADLGAVKWSFELEPDLAQGLAEYLGIQIEFL